MGPGRLILLLACLQASASGDVMNQTRNLIDFSEADASQWTVINDGVMGGISRSDLRRTDRNTGVFAGELSLENNGGFASVRAAIAPQDLSAFEGIEIRVRGDGRTYQLRLRTNDSFDGVAYRAFFDTRDGEWLTLVLPFADFLPTFRGRTLTDRPALDLSSIQQIAFMLADKTPGRFSLEIDHVRAVHRQEVRQP